ncbi:MAG: hypothetical protein LUH09_09735 [Clostridiales bacterium]|nr:hypothetical protein [Clostridiales bacterium]
MLLDKVTDASNSVVQERYITVSAHRKNVEEARNAVRRPWDETHSHKNSPDGFACPSCQLRRTHDTVFPV